MYTDQIIVNLVKYIFKMLENLPFIILVLFEFTYKKLLSIKKLKINDAQIETIAFY